MSEPTRKAAVAGQFYPGSCSKLSADINKFNLAFDKLNIKKEILNIVPRAVIVPHAGYIYSGFTANFAYRFLQNAKARRIIVIGPSHHHYFKGISGSYYEKYETPCGDIPIDSAYLFALAKEFNIAFEPLAHQREHSTEVQMPFIQHYFSDIPIIELIYGDMKAESLAPILSALLNNKDNLLVISTDLSHFHSLGRAKELDHTCLKAIEKLDSNKLKEGCEACGIIGIQALILAANKHRFKSKLLDYRTSANASGDSSSVVGYTSAIFY